MSNHSNPQVTAQNAKLTSAEISKVQLSLLDDLKTKWDEEVGMEWPTASNSVIHKIDVSLVYSSDPKVEEYTNGALDLLNGVFTGNEADVAMKAVELVKSVAEGIIGSNTLSIGLYGSAERWPIDNPKFIIGVMANNAKASSKGLVVTKDFYICEYVMAIYDAPEKATTFKKVSF